MTADTPRGTAETSSFPSDWDEREERYYTGEALDDPTAVPPPTPQERQRLEFGGVSVGASFFGWLSAVGVIGLLAGIVAAIALLVDLVQDPFATGGMRIGETSVLAGSIFAAVLLVIGAYAGGYVAGRLVRFDGGRQGVTVWCLLVVSVLVVGGLAVVVDARYSVRIRSSFPEIAVGLEDVLLVVGATAGAGLLLALLAALGGGMLGLRYHAKVDRAALDPEVAAPVDERPTGDPFDPAEGDATSPRGRDRVRLPGRRKRTVDHE